MSSSDDGAGAALIARWETTWPAYAHEQWPWPVHVLKTIDPYFDAVRQGHKRFEIRRNDRQFQPDDLLLLAHWTGQEFTGRAVLMKVTYVLRDGHDFGLADDFVCMSLAPFANEDLRRSFAAGPAKASSAPCFCGHPDDRERVHRAHACEPWTQRGASLVEGDGDR